MREVTTYLHFSERHATLDNVLLKELCVDAVWEISEAKDATSSVKIQSLEPVLVRVLQQRGMTSTEAMHRFLYGTIHDEYDPFLFKGMHQAVARIRQAVENKEGILVHGDYDVDGVTAAALLGKTLEELGVEYYLYLPERLKGGYGVSKKAIYYAREKKAKLIITVDCGISAYEEAELAKSFGIDFIVTDHHRPGREDLPCAYAIVNPWQAGCTYPFKELSGVGIAYKLVRALGINAHQKYLDLVAFGTVCDLSILSDENRLLVKEGLKQIDLGINCGLTALKKIAGVRGKRTNTGHLGFMLGPRINASGRLGSAECALRLLVTNNAREADSLALALDEENKERQKLEQLILQEAVKKVEREVNFNREKVIVVWNTSWHLGVIGIVAQRLVEKYTLPTIVISVDKDLGVCRGSARSVKGFNMFQALTDLHAYLLEYGGHEYAAGIEIEQKQLEAFRAALIQYVAQKTVPSTFIKTYAVDVEMGLADITPQLLSGLELLEPYGRGNPKPLFMTKNLYCKERSIFLNKNTVKLWVTDGTYTYEAIWYKAPVDIKIFKGDKLDIIYHVAQRYWYDRTVATLEIKDLRKL